MNLILFVVGGAGFIYLLIRKPELIAVLLFILIIARINFDLKQLPLNSRATLSLILFFRVLMDKTDIKFSSFLGNPYAKLFLFFLIYVILISLSQDLFTLDLLKESISSVLAAFFVYYFFLKLHSAKQLKAALIASGLICFADLAYTYVVFGGFPMHRIFDQFTSSDYSGTYYETLNGPNWNFFGQICGISFVFILSDIIKNRSTNKFTIFLLPIMLLGVLMSTSRSALLGLLIISILIILNGINYKEQKKRIVKISAFFIGTGLIALLLFATFGRFLNLDSKFVDELISRMSDEPVAILKKSLGQSYNINNLGSMYWREESSENAYSAYMNLSLREQFFGIGNTGFEVRDLGHGYNAHNAILLLLIENGIAGFLLFFLLVSGVIIQSVRKKNFSPSLAAVCFSIVYGLGQNREWTSISTYLFLFCVVAELQSLLILDKMRNIPDDLTSGQPLVKQKIAYEDPQNFK